MKHLPFVVSLAAMSLISGCATEGVEMVDTQNDTGAAVAGLDYRDLQKAATTAIQALLANPAMTNPNGGRYVLVVSNVTNDTMQRFDTTTLTQDIVTELQNSGRVAVTTAFGLNGPQDQMRAALVNSGAGDGRGSSAPIQRDAVRPDLSLSGKVIQHNVPAGNKVQIEYFLQLNMTQISTGLSLWGNQTKIIKRTRGDTATW